QRLAIRAGRDEQAHTRDRQPDGRRPKSKPHNDTSKAIRMRVGETGSGLFAGPATAGATDVWVRFRRTFDGQTARFSTGFDEVLRAGRGRFGSMSAQERRSA